MQLGFVSAILPELPLEEVLRTAAQTGYECVELMCWPPAAAERRYAGVTHVAVDGFSAADAERVNGLAADAGIAISGLGYYPNPLAPNEVEALAAVEHIAKVIRAAGMLGIGRMNTFVGRDWTKSVDDNWPRFLETWRPLVKLAEDCGVRIGIDPLGGASVAYWPRVIERYGIAATVVSEQVDPTFRFMAADWDGRIRMDCSSRYAMAGLIGLGAGFDVAFGNDTDADRHGIVAGADGLMDPNHVLAAAIGTLFAHRPAWGPAVGIGKTLVSSGVIDRLAARLGRPVTEVPVGFKWFAHGLLEGGLGFAGEESGGASFLRRDGTAWTTDKDGMIVGLLAAEMTARTGANPASAYARIAADVGRSWYARTDAPATAAERGLLKALTPGGIGMTELAGEPVRSAITTAPGNGAAIGGIKISSESGWFAARPSGTEDIYKVYAESFRSEAHLRAIQQDAKDALARVFRSAG